MADRINNLEKKLGQPKYRCLGESNGKYTENVCEKSKASNESTTIGGAALNRR